MGFLHSFKRLAESDSCLVRHKKIKKQVVLPTINSGNHRIPRSSCNDTTNLRGKIFELAWFNARPSSSSHLTNRLTQGGGGGGQFLNILRVRQAAAPRRSDRFQIIRATCFECSPRLASCFACTRARSLTRASVLAARGTATRLLFIIFNRGIRERYMYI